MRNSPSGRRDRALAAIELPALGVWLGALVGFAFVSAPVAVHVVAPPDPGQQGNMSRTADVLGVERSNLYRKMKAFGIAPSRRADEETEAV